MPSKPSLSFDVSSSNGELVMASWSWWDELIVSDKCEYLLMGYDGMGMSPVD